MPDPPSLGSLPVEILCSIFRLLDPVGLISINQTNSKFRTVVQPQRAHFLERLLELECREEVGGVIPIFQSNNRVHPDLTSKEWYDMRWVCSDCLQMLPHTAFGNNYILQLRYRKPFPGSPAASAYTSWEPTRDGKLRKQYNLHKQEPDSSHEEWRTRHRYHLASKSNISRHPVHDRGARLASFQDSGMITFQGFSLEEYCNITQEEEQVLLDHEAQLIEKEFCGFQRHLRNCNECCFQRGEFSFFVKRGTYKVPIVPSRRVSFTSALDRYFPGVAAIMRSVSPTPNAPVEWVYRRSAFDSLWTMYMVRCPGCLLWQEMRAFRLGGFSNHWIPTTDSASGFQNWDRTKITRSFINRLSCNHCFAKYQGREKLREILVKWLDCCLDSERRRLGRLLVSGWERLFERYQQLKQTRRINRYNELKNVVVGIQAVVVKAQKYQDYLRIGLCNILTLNTGFSEWLTVRKNIDSEDQHYLERGEGLWNDNYEVIEAHLIWVIQCKMEISDKTKGDDLVDWVLSREGSTLA